MRTLKLNPNKELIESLVPSDLGPRIRRIRKEQKMTIQELANAMGCSSTHLTRIELGERQVDSVALIATIAQSLQVSPQELLGNNPPSTGALIRSAFPGVQSEKQEQVLIQLASIIANKGLTDSQLEAMLEQATAYAEYCSNRT